MVLQRDSEDASEARSFKTLHAALHELALLLEGDAAPDQQEIDRLVALYDDLCELLYQANLGLVYDMRRRTATGRLDPADVESDGCLALLRAVRTFNPWMGFRFSTYACRSIQRAFHLLTRRKFQQSRLMQEKIKRIQDAGPAPEYNLAPVGSDSPTLDRLRGILVNNEARLTTTERLVITQRFLLGEGRRPATLGAVGRMLRLSKERVRQIQIAALDKLRTVVESELGRGRAPVAEASAQDSATAGVDTRTISNLILNLKPNEQAA